MKLMSSRVQVPVYRRAHHRDNDFGVQQAIVVVSSQQVLAADLGEKFLGAIFTKGHLAAVHQGYFFSIDIQQRNLIIRLAGQNDSQWETDMTTATHHDEFGSCL